VDASRDNNSFLLAIGQQYPISMHAFALAGNSTDLSTVRAVIDPWLEVPDGFTLTFGEGIGNEPIPETPLPAARPLFATGLGALGLLGWRRKRKQAA
jgi:hypothetical protein